MPEDSFVFGEFAFGFDNDFYYIVDSHAVENHLRHQGNGAAREAALDHIGNARIYCPD